MLKLSRPEKKIVIRKHIPCGGERRGNGCLLVLAPILWSVRRVPAFFCRRPLDHFLDPIDCQIENQDAEDDSYGVENEPEKQAFSVIGVSAKPVLAQDGCD
mmetsp:Transcript_44037/g.171899  ORF Transcript_44037/g.171899 Transcript_44037/m.171899 type:complete len:101 (+) Transcript_44037:790-1092(+)